MAATATQRKGWMEDAYARILDELDLEERVESFRPLRRGNSKLGKGRGVFHTGHLPMVGCCGYTEACAEVCYAAAFLRRYHSTQEFYGLSQLLLDKDRETYFAKVEDQLTRARSCEVVRWHVSGDFIDADHVERWTTVVRQFPETQFFGYTRSWRPGGEILEALEQLRTEDNVELLASMDHECEDEAAEVVPHWRWADIVEEDEEGWQPGWREIDGRVGLTCPNQLDDEIKCADCTYCFTDRDGDLRLRLH